MAVTTWSGFIIPSHLNCPRMKAEVQKLTDTYKSTDASYEVLPPLINGGYFRPTWHLSDSCRDAIIAIENRMITELGALPGYSPEIIAERTHKNTKNSNRFPRAIDTVKPRERIEGSTIFLLDSLIPLLANIEHEAMSAQYTAAVPALEARLAAAEEFIQTQAAALKAAEDRQIAVAAAAIFASQKLKEQEEINKKLLERLSALEKTF
jgi:hypothetical protein